MRYPIAPLAIPLWRMIHPYHQRTPLSGEGARLYGGRWNGKGVPALYLATDPVTAIAEYYQGLPKPGMLAPYRLEATLIADLTNGKGHPADSMVAAATTADWKHIAFLENQLPPSWNIAQALLADGAEGALVPSVQNRSGTNLVLWRWHDGSKPGTGAVLTLLDPERTLTGR